MKSKGIGLALILVILLAACGTTTQVSTSLYATRSESLPGYHFAPFERTVTNTTAVQQLYAAAMVLPTPQPGVYSFTSVCARLSETNKEASACTATRSSTGCDDQGEISYFTIISLIFLREVI